MPVIAGVVNCHVLRANLLKAVGGALRPKCHDYDSAISLGVTRESEHPQREDLGYTSLTRAAGNGS